MISEEELQKDIEEWAEILDTEIVQKPNLPGMMYVEYEPPRIEGPILSTFEAPFALTHQDNVQICYLTMMHELGHVYYGHTQGRPPHWDQTHYFDNGVLNSEAEAWNWALDNMLLENLSRNTVLIVRDKFIGSYHAHALKVGLYTPGQRLGNGNRHWIAFSYGSDRTTVKVKERMTELISEEVPV